MLKPAPETLIWETFTLELPTLVSVTVWVLLLVSATFPRLKLVGVADSCGWSLPPPLVEPDALPAVPPQHTRLEAPSNATARARLSRCRRAVSQRVRYGLQQVKGLGETFMLSITRPFQNSKYREKAGVATGQTFSTGTGGNSVRSRVGKNQATSARHFQSDRLAEVVCKFANSFLNRRQP